MELACYDSKGIPVRTTSVDLTFPIYFLSYYIYIPPFYQGTKFTSRFLFLDIFNLADNSANSDVSIGKF